MSLELPMPPCIQLLEEPERSQNLAAPRPLQQLEKEASSHSSSLPTPNPRAKTLLKVRVQEGQGTCHGPGQQCQGGQERQRWPYPLEK